ncbi:aminotransferase class I/II-fold pyridoxal phosphate-dependent enzyme [Periweissella beninensis]|uniref:aminotransferase class I/II-fold pyridoxal phosphate-dependent enzyme n=1 Tax=Periweissella beninensis TaxID=504936 RepID=UPI0021A429DF|nr:aminotransferase class I/II-fold pyridoxal phosphate-dependent enzyme [Periweissella beninensis]MCT4396205.1 aminotransferase class I/II-fold pyridoxal phosphate-dependent enzyme [Periweissella beninensis]
MPKLKASLSKKTNEKLLAIRPSAIRAFDEQVSNIPDILKLTLGEPDFDVPEIIKNAAITSIKENDSHYAASRGTTALRNAIKAFLQRKYHLTYDALNEIIVTIGATEALAATIATTINPGDEVLIPTPTFPLYEAIVKTYGGIPVLVNTATDNFILTANRLAQELAKHPQIKLVVLNFPSNPTGVTYTEPQLSEISSVLKEKDVFVLTDEIYSELTYDHKHTSIAKYLPNQTILINGASKAFAMTGYRIGLIAGPAELIIEITKMHQFTITTPVNSSMAAATTAFLAGDIDSEKMKQSYLQRRNYLMEALDNLGLSYLLPKGAFYLFIKIPANYQTDDFKFALDLAKKGHVALVPGSVFGPGGEGFVRLSYAASQKKLEEAIKRIEKFILNN